MRIRRLFHGWAMCRSMFCYIPSPWRIWDEEARPWMPLFLPVLGLELGALWWGLAWLTRHFDIPLPLAALVLCVYPFAVTGAIHLDGFMDVVDAVRSCADRDRRRAILKDPHVGGFAVAGCAVLLLSFYSIFFVGAGDIRLLLLVPVVSRCGSALAVTMLPPLSSSQYATAHMQKKHAVVLIVFLALALTVGFVLYQASGWCLVIELVAYSLALLRGYRALEGMNGDVAGYALTVSELCGVAALVLI